ncbi:MAG: hypothetical protein PHX83_07070 [Acidobacteriia bacterium]|nr:hypothetical protein [Terriglobia bacterium]
MKRTPKPSNPYRVRRVWPWTWKTCEVCGCQFRWEFGIMWEHPVSIKLDSLADVARSIGESFSAAVFGRMEDPATESVFACSDCAPPDETLDIREVERWEKARDAERSGEIPTKNDDVTMGFTVGSVWRKGLRQYINEDATEGRAVWREICVPKEADEPTYSATGANNDLCSALESIGADPAAATAEQIAEALNTTQRDGHYSVHVDESGLASIGFAGNSFGTSHVEIVPWSPDGKSREELVERIEFLDRLSDEQIDLNERREAWLAGLVEDLGVDGRADLDDYERRGHVWPTEYNAPEPDKEQPVDKPSSEVPLQVAPDGDVYWDTSKEPTPRYIKIRDDNGEHSFEESKIVNSTGTFIIDGQPVNVFFNPLLFKNENHPTAEELNAFFSTESFMEHLHALTTPELLDQARTNYAAECKLTAEWTCWFDSLRERFDGVFEYVPNSGQRKRTCRVWDSAAKVLPWPTFHEEEKDRARRLEEADDSDYGD